MNSREKDVLVMALYAGEIMLKNGAETYRVEDTVMRICKAYKISYVESFVTPTGIFVSVDCRENGGDVLTFIKRIVERTIDLNKISKVNDFSRKVSSSFLSIEEALEILKKIDHLPKYPKFLKIFGAATASSFFGVMLGATYSDFISVLITSICIYISISFTEKLNSNFFIQNLFGGAIAAFIAILSIHIGVGIHLDKIIISSIMILVPGVAITNAVRDYISGDLLSGAARTAEAFIVAIAIAVGAGAVMNTWIYIFGGI
ncbi:threonine/serine ThrE exporter family protein [Anaerophilus nitritogenes]|uniref:threonine/serine ThrE exporter family protein n=1 Tax=Anaerophilus nitritogenes TaxID=2498136 RepID=UPI00101DEB99|nr:threonine/serine exporter family protein [Anaerophilus nitritogenes]